MLYSYVEAGHILRTRIQMNDGHQVILHYVITGDKSKQLQSTNIFPLASSFNKIIHHKTQTHDVKVYG